MGKILQETIRRALLVFSPPPVISISDWADRNRILPKEASSEPGRWNTDRAAYQREIMNAIKDPSIDEVVVMSSAQVGKTEILLNMIGYFIDHEPSPILMVQPTVEMAEAFSKDRLSTMIRDTFCLREKVSLAGSRKSGNTILHKTFPGGHITMSGANSAASLASRPVRVVLFDEVDRYGESAGTERDPVFLGKKRTSTFFNRVVVLVSTPTIKGASRIEKAFFGSDQRKFYVPCPRCNHLFCFNFKRLKWEKEKIGNPWFVCEECSCKIYNSDKFKMLKKGRWLPQEPKKKGVAGFHINELYSPWRSWSEVVLDFLKAKKDREQLKTFVNTSLGETWEALGDKPDYELLYNRRSSYSRNEIPEGVYFLTAAVDVQKDRLELEIKGWGKNKHCWSIDYRVIVGDTSQPEVYLELDRLLGETWEDSEGYELTIERLGIDSGYNTMTVYSWCRRHGSRVMAVKGFKSLTSLLGHPKGQDINVSNGRTLKRGVYLWPVGTDVGKREIYSYLKSPLPEEGQGYPIGFSFFPKDYGLEYFKSLCSEVESYKLVDGLRRFYFEKIYEHNEVLDLAVYNRAVACSLGMDRMRGKNFANYRRSLRKSQDNPPVKI